MQSYILSAETILQQIDLELRSIFPKRSGNRLRDFNFDIRIAITTDLYETEFDFTKRYGVGFPFHFSLSSYEQGKRLAQELYIQITGTTPDMAPYSGEGFKRSDLLILFIYVQDIRPRQEDQNNTEVSLISNGGSISHGGVTAFRSDPNLQ